MIAYEVKQSQPDFGGMQTLFVEVEGKRVGLPPALECEPGDQLVIADKGGGDVSLLSQAWGGERGPDQEAIADAAIAWAATILRKNADYGSSVWSVPMLAPDMTAGDAILVRMTDKIHRIAALRSKGPEVKGESLEDSIRDLGAYCLLYLSRPK